MTKTLLIEALVKANLLGYCLGRSQELTLEICVVLEHSLSRGTQEIDRSCL